LSEGLVEILNQIFLILLSVNRETIVVVLTLYKKKFSDLLNIGVSVHFG